MLSRLKSRTCQVRKQPRVQTALFGLIPLLLLIAFSANADSASDSQRKSDDNDLCELIHMSGEQGKNTTIICPSLDDAEVASSPTDNNNTSDAQSTANDQEQCKIIHMSDAQGKSIAVICSPDLPDVPTEPTRYGDNSSDAQGKANAQEQCELSHMSDDQGKHISITCPAFDDDASNSQDKADPQTLCKLIPMSGAQGKQGKDKRIAVICRLINGNSSDDNNAIKSD